MNVITYPCWLNHVSKGDHRSVSLDSELISCPFTAVVKHTSKSFRTGDLWRLGCGDIVQYAVGRQFVSSLAVVESRCHVTGP